MSSEEVHCQIQCSDRLLKIVHLRRIFKDSKTVVDMNLLKDRRETFQDFNFLMESTECEPTDEMLSKFLADNFENLGEIEDCTPEDFKACPKFLDGITDKDMKEFAQDLVAIWPKLARRVKSDVFKHPDKYTLVPVPNPFIIPGGRFKEIYYWDSYWIIKGLLLSEMVETAKGMLENFFHLVNNFGFVPNGNRVYYLNRSQPPLLTMAVSEYLKVTKDYDWLKLHIDTIEKELLYWVNEKSVEVEKNGRKYTVLRYVTRNCTPRPESYFEDVHTSSVFHLDVDKGKCYSEIRASAESGWDFSSRWIFDSDQYDLCHLQATRVAPVDLNSFLCKSFLEISKFFEILNDLEKAKFWNNKWMNLEKAIEEVFYDDEDGIWYDFDIKLGVNRKEFYTSNFTPLWTESYDPSRAKEYGKRAVEYLRNMDVLKYEGGIPTSLYPTGQQWDFPNSWAPLQDIVIMGLEKSGDPCAQKVAKDLATRWIKANMIGYEETNAMFEKYDARFCGKYGGGGEYEVQSGFGWTNGVVLMFIDYFYSDNKKML
ncbi:unnamed protein product [Brassicogethes aeneus]|uniref:Trehalase n=1 Tax=Brassicogethes aeneus TaxID=1431903 RepID=A0A9P0FR69_BRAAE|nr:unnamed protein product [Brassicogethes aeneus]